MSENERKPILIVEKGTDGSVTCRFKGEKDSKEIGALAYLVVALANRLNGTVNDVLEATQCILDEMYEDERFRTQTGVDMWKDYETLDAIKNDLQQPSVD